MRVSGIALWACCAGAALAAEAEMSAERIVESSGVKAGLCVQLGVTDGRLVADLGESGRFLVHGLALDETSTATAREHVRSRGLAGRVSVEKASAGKLPCTEDIVSLMVVARQAKVWEVGEIVRVLAPNGVACFEDQPIEQGPGYQVLRKVGGWTLIAKSRPDGMDEWTHGHYGPGGNRASQDRLTGPPEGIRWIAGADWPQSTYLAGTMVSAGGRIFIVRTETPDRPTTVDWTYLSARDAYNGLLLWKRRATGCKRLATVATADYLISNLGAQGELVALNALTGEPAVAYKEAGPAQLAVVSGDRLLVSTGFKRLSDALRCLDVKSGRLLWTSKATCSAIDRLPNVAVEGDRVYALDNNKRLLHCVDLATGAVQWQQDLSGQIPPEKSVAASIASFGAGTLLVAADRDARGDGLHAFSAADGKHLWSHKHVLVISGRADRHKASSYRDVFFIDGLFWVHVGRPFSKELPGGGDSWQGLDPATGQVKKTHSYPDEHRAGDPCYPATATVRYFMGGHSYFMDTQTGKYVKMLKDVDVHGGCRFGVIAGNGLLYTNSMYMYGYFMFGDFGLAARPAIEEADPAPPLEKGPAYGTSLGEPAAETDWTCFRRDAGRSNRTPADVPAELSQLWEAQVGSPKVATDGFGVALSAPTVAGGSVFVTSVEEHTVAALGAATGERRWSFTAGGRVRIAPTSYRGLCLFGSADGYVYCLRASDGELVWRFRAARADRRTIHREKLESVWPADHGVVIVEDKAFFAAGRNGALDGGIDVFAVEPASGKVVWSARQRNPAHLQVLGAEPRGLAVSASYGHRLDGQPVKTAFFGGRLEVFDEHAIDPKLVIGERQSDAKTQVRMPMVVEAMIRAGSTLLVAGSPQAPVPARGTPAELAKTDALRWYESRAGQAFYRLPQDESERTTCVLRVYALPEGDAGGQKLSELQLPARPVFGAMAAANGRVYLCTQDGKLRCFGKKR